MDIYVWVKTEDRPAVLSRFIDGYVDADRPGEPRFDSFVRVLVAQAPGVGDLDALAELRRNEEALGAFSLYLRAKTYHQAIITVTEEGDLVLGLSLDDPDGESHIQMQAAALMRSLMREFDAVGGVAGVELPPPQSAPEWHDEGMVMLRDGSV